ncbi:MAG: hypothetical protein P1U56_16890 [Saprospiraceae bacterium]|nr:hypothetical protein [Saprospiraceae bacterium]
MKAKLIYLVFFGFLTSCSSGLNKSTCIYDRYSEMSNDIKDYLKLDMQTSYKESIIYSDTKEKVIYQFWKEASHSSKDNFYLVNGNDIIFLKKNLGDIKTALVMNEIEKDVIEKIMSKLTQIKDCEIAKPKNKF